MDALLQTLAESSPIAAVSIVAIWRISAVMMKLVDAFVDITKAQADSVTDLIEKQTAN